MENNNENLKNSNSENSSFFEQKVSSSNGNEEIPKLRFSSFSDKYKKIYLKEISNRIKRSNPNSEAPVMMISAASGFINQTEKYSRDNAGKSLKKYTLLKKGELAYNHGASKIKPYGCCFELLEEEARIPYVYHCFKINNEYSTSYIAKYLNNSKTDSYLKKIVSSSVRMDGLLNISYEDYTDMLLLVPSIKEQQKIADFLSLIDQRIEKQRQLVENLKKYKRGLLSAIFERKIRFKDDNGNDYPEWNKIPLGSIFVERVEKATGNEELLSVTINEGIKKRNTIDIKDNSSEDKSHYKKVYKDDIAYNTMRMWQGASGVSKYNGMVSPAYTVISPKIDVNIDFWSYYLKYYKIIHLFQKFSQGLTSDTWNLKFPQFAEIKVLVPSKVEQEKLAEILLTFDNNINIYQNYLDKLEQLKKSLLQQMFI